jgi:hypothetical protein
MKLIPDQEAAKSVASSFKFMVRDADAEPKITFSDLNVLFNALKQLPETGVIEAIRRLDAVLIQCGFMSLQEWIKHILTMDGKDCIYWPDSLQLYKR